mgnify:FL=1
MDRFMLSKRYFKMIEGVFKKSVPKREGECFEWGQNSSFYWVRSTYSRCPYIIKYKEAFIEDNPSTLCIVMEYADGGDLYEAIK